MAQTSKLGYKELCLSHRDQQDIARTFEPAWLVPAAWLKADFVLAMKSQKWQEEGRYSDSGARMPGFIFHYTM